MPQPNKSRTSPAYCLQSGMLTASFVRFENLYTPDRSSRSSARVCYPSRKQSPDFLGGGPMKRIFTALFVALVGINMTCPSVGAQATAQISGTVRDQSGAVLPGVEVTATQTDTPIHSQAISIATEPWI